MKSNKPLIVHITSGSILAGAERLLLEILPELKNEFPDSEVFVVVFGKVQHLGNLNLELDKLGIRNRSFLMEGLLKKISFFHWILRFFSKNHVSIVHSHLFYGGLLGASIKLFFPRCYFIHTRHYSDYFNTVENSNFKYLADRYITNAKADKIISISKNVQRALLLEKVPAKKIALIYNGISSFKQKDRMGASEDSRAHIDKQIDAFRRKNLNPLIFYSIGTLAVCKGQINILILMKKLKLEGFIQPLCILIGDGLEKSKLNTFVEENAIEENIIFLGYQENPYKFTAQCDVFIHLPIEEGFGLVVCEAMREKKMILAACVGGIPEIIENGKSGFLVPPDNIPVQVELVRKIFSLSITEKNDILINAYNRYLEKFSSKKMVEAYKQLYNNILRK